MYSPFVALADGATDIRLQPAFRNASSYALAATSGDAIAAVTANVDLFFSSRMTISALPCGCGISFGHSGASPPGSAAGMRREKTTVVFAPPPA